MNQPNTLRSAVFTETHLGTTTQYKLTPESDRYLLASGFDMGGGSDHTERLYTYRSPLAEDDRGV